MKPQATSRLAARTRALFGAWVLVLLASVSTANADGSLLIVGGALKEDNAQVHRALIDAMLPHGKMVIIPVASGRPAKSAAEFAGSLQRYGLAKDRIAIFPLAVRDDSTTDGVDESRWEGNAWNENAVAAIIDAAGFWFTGGDQLRITQTMLGKDGEESPLLVLVRKRLAEGAVVGGTSAGAAIMSKDMIAGGISFTALLEPLAGSYSDTEDQDSGRLYLAKGLGFLDNGVVDQHFDRKARLGRLVRALAETGQTRGFGIDENTALLVRPDSNSAKVLGRGSVVLLNAREARFDFDSKTMASGLKLSILAPGVRFRLGNFALLDGQGDATVGNEYFGYRPLQGGGMALANSRLDQALGFDLLDNDSTQRLDRYSIDDSGRIILYRFTQTDNSTGFWQNEGSADRYTVSNVRMDILELEADLPDH
jgi:cyanophycinase